MHANSLFSKLSPVQRSPLDEMKHKEYEKDIGGERA